MRKDIKQVVLAPLGSRHSEKPREVQDRPFTPPERLAAATWAPPARDAAAR